MAYRKRRSFGRKRRSYSKRRRSVRPQKIGWRQ